MNEVYLLLGSNQGEREQYLHAAFSGLKRLLGSEVKFSGVYETAAWGKTGQPDFLNQAVVFRLEKGREMWLLDEINKLESGLGRLRKEKWGERVIDIDIIFSGSEVIQTERLTVPHPYLHLRRFVLEPLNEIAPDLEHPVLKKQVKELLEACPDQLSVKKVSP